MKKLNLLTIIGARPQIIKAAAVSRAIKNNFSDRITEILVHTGQHYDDNMSQVFFKELGIPQPDYNLKIGSGNHATQTSKMLDAIGELLLKINPDALLLYGDTNSTLAAAIAASKLQVPVIHVEGGLRSNSKIYPEEINRIMTDHVSSLIFTPTRDGYDNLVKEGFRMDNQPPFTIDNPGIYHCGDIMLDNSLHFAQIASANTNIINQNKLQPNKFILVTVHRENNTNDPARLNAIFSAIVKIAEEDKIKVVIPIHPRTAKILESMLEESLYRKVTNSQWVKVIPPASFLEIIELERNAKLIMTDSGGVQKEAYFFKKPAIIFLRETPWVELVSSGAARLVDADENKIHSAYEHYKNKQKLEFKSFYGDGKAAEFVCEKILANFANQSN